MLDFRDVLDVQGAFKISLEVVVVGVEGLDAGIDAADGLLERIDVILEDSRILVEGVVGDQIFHLVELGSDRFGLESSHYDFLFLVGVAVDTLESAADKWRFASRVAAFVHISKVVLRALDLL